MVTPKRGLLFHFTHISNLASIAQHGLHSDLGMEALGRKFMPIGHPKIKRQRQRRRVPIEPGGRVADYVPFYFATRSPMLNAIFKNNVPSYSGGQDEVVHLVTSIEKIRQHGLPFVFTDRNAALGNASYGADLEVLDDYVDWDLMEARMWQSSDAEPHRRERRMAEFLVYHHVPWSAFIGVAARNEAKCHQVEHALHNVGVTTHLRPRPDWYFQ